MSYANVVATFALVFAMSGGALAASKFLITSTKQIKPSVLAQLKGRNGAAGAQGPAGPAGSVGPQGNPGANGRDGVNGGQGPAGPTGPKGATGATGQTGFTKTLPKGETETGVWAMDQFEVPLEQSVTPAQISFSIPLPATGTAYYITESETNAKAGKVVTASGCTGSATEPTAPEGTLCVYASTESIFEGAGTPHVEAIKGAGKYSKTGAFLELELLAKGSVFAQGSWAVTAA